MFLLMSTTNVSTMIEFFIVPLESEGALQSGSLAPSDSQGENIHLTLVLLGLYI